MYGDNAYGKFSFFDQKFSFFDSTGERGRGRKNEMQKKERQANEKKRDAK